MNGEIGNCSIKTLEPKTQEELGLDEPFPFNSSTPLYPEWPVGVLAHVPQEVAKAVAEALFQITKNSTAAIQGKYASWIPPLSYLSLNTMQEKLGWISEGKCMRSDNFYNAVVCPAGYVKKSEAEMDRSCVDDDADSGWVNTTACPPGTSVCVALVRKCQIKPTPSR